MYFLMNQNVVKKTGKKLGIKISKMLRKYTIDTETNILKIFKLIKH